MTDPDYGIAMRRIAQARGLAVVARNCVKPPPSTQDNQTCAKPTQSLPFSCSSSKW